MAYKNVELGAKAPEIVNAVIEIPRGMSNKYEYDEELDEIRLDRVLYSPMFYPTDYGFIPHTRSEDGDHLDVMVLLSRPAFPGCIIEVRPVGVLDMEDENGIDWKIIAVATRDPRSEGVTSIDKVNEHLRKEIVHFFESYKKLEGKEVTVRGWKDRIEAQGLINAAAKRFKAELR